MMIYRFILLLIIGSFVFILTSCDKKESNITETIPPASIDSIGIGNPPAGKDSIYDTDANGIPHLVNNLYINIDSIYKISRFRSGIGHDYSDNFESCRSMKHYFFPEANSDWSKLELYSPVNGTVVKAEKEHSLGIQLWICSDSIPAFNFIIFHTVTNLKPGDKVTAGMLLGHHVGTETTSDIAVGVYTPGGYKLVSYFDTFTDDLLNRLKNYNISSRKAMIITRDERDASPLICNGESFSSEGSIENWIIVNP